MVLNNDMKKNVLYLLFMFACCTTACSQAAFEDEIKSFQQEDSISSPPRNAILFVGSSSFRLWKNLKEDFSKHTVINRGFGGSSLQDVFYHKERIIYPY